MHISDHLIERFLSGGCTEEEKEQVMEFFKNHPEKLAQVLTEESWVNFDPEARYGTPAPEVRQAIENRVGKAPVRKMIVSRMAAAVVIFLICLLSLLYWTSGNKNKKNIGPGRETAMQPAVNKEERNAGLQTITNETPKDKMYSLPDGSKMKLGAGSVVSFNNPFINQRRDLFLKGEAVFTVMKDKVRPFTVHSKGFATTALGTVFSVNDKGGLFTTVQLYSGRIVVKKEEGNTERPFKNVYLQPGQQLVLNKADFSVQIKTIAPVTIAAKEENKSSQPPLLKFAKQPLTEILSLLEKECKATISYDPARMINMDFTGTFDPGKETLESFLSTLCSLNELTLIKRNSHSYSIQLK